MVTYKQSLWPSLGTGGFSPGKPNPGAYTLDASQLLLSMAHSPELCHVQICETHGPQKQGRGHNCTQAHHVQKTPRIKVFKAKFTLATDLASQRRLTGSTGDIICMYKSVHLPLQHNRQFLPPFLTIRVNESLAINWVLVYWVVSLLWCLAIRYYFQILELVHTGLVLFLSLSFPLLITRVFLLFQNSLALMS